MSAPFLRKVAFLDFEYCATSVNDDVLRAIGTYCPGLLRLQLAGCRGITDSGLRALADGCSRPLASLKPLLVFIMLSDVCLHVRASIMLQQTPLR